VKAASADDAWAVGVSGVGTSSSEAHLLAQHWNGSKWAVVPVSNPTGAAWAQFDNVDTISPNDVWAVGFYSVSGQGDTDLPLAAHWNGSTWTAAPAPLPKGATEAGLYNLVAISATNIWAVGQSQVGSGNNPAFSTLVEHWNGHAWKIVSTPGSGTLLYGITKVSPDDVWVAGYTSKTTPLVERWNGHSWRVIPSTLPAGSAGAFLGLAGLSDTNMWAAGLLFQPTGVERTLIEHWNGSTWKITASPTPSSKSGVISSVLFGITASSSSAAWAVGATQVNPSSGIIEHWNGHAWKRSKLLPGHV
jgi:hypothetical protein